MFMRARKVISKNKLRYLSLFAGFFLFVAPFALLTRLVYFLLGNVAEPDLHTICLRMPIDWIFGGKFYMIFGSVMAGFVILVLILSLFVGPLFCGWLCPVGAVSEGISRLIPIPNRFRIFVKDTKVTMGLRYGFLAGFVAISMLVGYKIIASTDISTICCRYCTSSVLQNIAIGVFGNITAVEYWHTGAILSLTAWLIIGGIFMVGGRGWCLFFCPLGALSGLIHKAGAKLGFYRMRFDSTKCKDCKTCKTVCPTWAINDNHSIETSLCINCKECSNLCPSGAFVFNRGKENAKLVS